MSDKPPLPEAFNIPNPTIQKWLAMDENAELELTVTRRDLDNLYFAIDHGLSAQMSLQNCLLHYSNGRLDEANNESWEAQRKLVEAANRLRQFMNGIMSAASK